MPHAIHARTVYHIISRFVGGEWFIEGEHERSHYLHLLGLALRTSDWRCIAYAVMSNHIHLAMIAGSMPRSTWLREAHSPFGEWINRRKERIGSVFAKGTYVCATDPAHVDVLIAYIHNNPVRAGVVSSAIESTWTSHRAYLGLSEPPSWLDIRQGVALIPPARQPRSAFDEWVRGQASRPAMPRAKRGRPKKAKPPTTSLQVQKSLID
jgi:putative transposase